MIILAAVKEKDIVISSVGIKRKEKLQEARTQNQALEDVFLIMSKLS